jgi:opacity protein-like surface antigen
MFNLFYDFSPYTMFTPYVMGSVGLSTIENAEKSGGIGTDFNLKNDNFTWAVGGGLSAKMTNRWNIDLGYRFFNLGQNNEATVRAHEVYLGTRYVF